MNILDQILSTKRKEVEARKSERPVHLLEATGFFERQTLSLKRSILDPAKTGIIAEFKRRSPSKGVINGAADVFDVTSGYTEFGASGLSVLTDTKYFGTCSRRRPMPNRRWRRALNCTASPAASNRGEC